MEGITVIIPVYNTMKYIDDCVQSLLAQTINQKGLIKYIFVDDCSTDDSGKTLDNYVQLYPDLFHVIHHETNLRVGGARNTGIHYADTEWIGFVDSDDYIFPSMFEDLYDKAMSANYEAVFIQYANVSEDSEYRSEVIRGGWKPKVKWPPELLNCGDRELDETDLMKLIAYPIGGVYCGIYKRKTIEDHQVYFPEQLRYEDNYWGSLIKPYFHKVGFVNKIGYFYRFNPASITHTRNVRYQIEDRITIEKMLIKEVKRRNLYDRYYTAWEYIYIYRYANNTYQVYMNRNDKIDYTILKSLYEDLRQEFPNWKHNYFYGNNHNWKYHLMTIIRSTIPILFAHVHRLLHHFMN